MTERELKRQLFILLDDWVESLYGRDQLLKMIPSLYKQANYVQLEDIKEMLYNKCSLEVQHLGSRCGWDRLTIRRCDWDTLWGRLQEG